MENKLEVDCPICGATNDLSSDNWRDELLDDSELTEVKCFECGYDIYIESEITIKLKVNIDND